jgi:esterase/lipase superfamily enzyme
MRKSLGFGARLRPDDFPPSDLERQGARSGARRSAVERLAGFFVLCLALQLAGCAGRPEGVLTPVAANTLSPQASTVTMLVATSRKPSGDPATLFSGERSPLLSLTDMEISIPPNRAVGTVEWPKRLPADPSKEFAVVRAQKLDSAKEGLTWLHKHNDDGHVLLFVHGFNNRYEDSVFRFAQIVHDSEAAVAPVLFTWPSRASVFDYNYDKESTNFSRTALERTLATIAADRGVTRITVMAHSMGTWLAMEALRQMAIRDGSLPAKIENVILASPDLDVDVFARQWWELGERKPKITIFVSQDDRALRASRLLSGGVDRVGQIDPTAEPYRTKLEEAGITVVDLTEIRSGDRLNHGKFAESPEIVRLIGTRLVAGQPLTDSNVGLGHSIGAVVAGTVGTVGNVAAATVAAPVNILEGKKPLYQKRKTEEIGTILQGDPTE